MSKEIKLALAILVVGFAAIAAYRYVQTHPSESSATPIQTSQTQEKVFLPANDYIDSLAEVKAYKEALRQSMRRGEAFLPLDRTELDAHARRVQEVLLRYEPFVRYTRVQGKQVHSEMMRIVPALEASLSGKLKAACQTGQCYQAEMYNFVTNATTRAVVDAQSGKVLSVMHFPDTQPEISRRLQKVAEAIALGAPEVSQALGHTPRRIEITMANVRGSMRESPCEDTTHLCVAPTFADVRRERALWAVVDLTGLRLAAAKWAPLGKSATPACISERTLQNRYIMENFCRRSQVLERNGWKLRYRLTGSDGLEIRDVSYKGKPVLHSAKIVDWHVSYAQQHGASDLNMSQPVEIAGRRAEFVRIDDERYMFGYNDAMGCPMFSTSAVLAFDGPRVQDIPGGFRLTQDFRNPKWPLACNYRYENRFEFYDDGSFRIVGVNKGRGCGSDALYRPVMRIHLAPDDMRVYVETNASRRHVAQEFYEPVRNGTRPYRFVSASRHEGYALEPNRGQFGDKSRGDHATLFVTRFHAQEGDTDMLTLGSCCKLDEDGPERFVNGETLEGDIVLWYVPRIYNDDRPGHEYCWADTVIDAEGNLAVNVWPCAVGPKFVPIQGE